MPSRSKKKIQRGNQSQSNLSIILDRKAMKGLIKMVSEEYDVDVIYLSIVEENEVAYHLYTSLEFEYKEDEEDPNG